MFIFPVNPEELFHERAVQMKAWGIPTGIIQQVRASVTDNWKDGDGGWTTEWVKVARVAEEQKKWMLASACYGAAKFPVACTAERKFALSKQVECYLKGANSFSSKLDRRILTVPYRNGTTTVPVHIFGLLSGSSKPLICLSGGVDTFKMEIHRLALGLAKFCGAVVAVIDMPGTGESTISLTEDAEEIYIGVLRSVRTELASSAKTAVFGISFGGVWAAKLALTGEVDAAVNFGGPVGYSKKWTPEYLENLPFGMFGTFGNAMGFEHLPRATEVFDVISRISLRNQGLLTPGKKTRPLLVINGENDQYVPIEDTTVFSSLPNAEVRVVRGTTHCASEKLVRVMPSIVSWLRLQLHGRDFSSRILDAASRIICPAFASNFDKFEKTTVM